MKTIILARVSSKDQEDGQSIPSQVRRLTEYALKKNLKVVQTLQITESSTKETRKQFSEILAYIKQSKEPIALVTDTVDRLQRSFRETPLLDEMRKQGKVELHFLREGLIVNRNSNSAQLMQWDIGVLFASSYVRQLSDNVKRSKEQSVKNGEWIGKAPYGYKNVTLPTGKKVIEVDQEAAPFVVKMFEMYASGLHSFQTIANEMTRLGLKNKEGNEITMSRVEITLKNPFYFGIMRVKGEFFPHKYPPLVSEALFDQAQEVMIGHNKKPFQYAAKPILFRGLISCKHCGCGVTGDIKKKKYIYYSCTNSKRVCQKVWTREEDLLAPLMEYLDRIQLPDAVIEEIVDYLKKAYAHEQAFFKTSQEALRKELDAIQNRLSKLVDMHLDGGIDSETYHSKLEEYKKRQREITSEMEAHVNADETCIITAKTVLDLAKRAKELFMSSKLGEKQQLLNFVFSNFQLEGKRLLVTLREPFLTLTALSHQPVSLRVQDSNLRPID
jgi:site-specific DNA recombinase